MAQCIALITNHGRTYRCGRRPSAKADNGLCGHHQPRPPRCGGDGTGRTYHRDDCAGCRLSCCQEGSER